MAGAIYLCGPDPTLVAEPCPAGGEPHDPVPSGYGARQEYAGQLLHAGWKAHCCPACGLWALWRDQGGVKQPMPPMEIRDEPYVIRDGPGCRACRDGRPCRAVTP